MHLKNLIDLHKYLIWKVFFVLFFQDAPEGIHKPSEGQFNKLSSSATAEPTTNNSAASRRSSLRSTCDFLKVSAPCLSFVVPVWLWSFLRKPLSWSHFFFTFTDGWQLSDSYVPWSVHLFWSFRKFVLLIAGQYCAIKALAGFLRVLWTVSWNCSLFRSSISLSVKWIHWYVLFSLCHKLQFPFFNILLQFLWHSFLL